MANEGRANVSLSFNKDSTRHDLSLSKTFTIDGDCFVDSVQQIGNTKEEVVQVSELGNAGYVMLKNIGDTNSIYVGFNDVSTADDAMPICLEPGDIALYRHNYNEQAAIYARTSAGTSNLRYVIYED